ncbi:MAG: type II toxin-antitoxin system VapC family toxin [Deltaproteobacteria bacterium]
MTLKLFIDTWGWLALRDNGEAKHREAGEIYSKFRRDGAAIYTSEYVMDETLTLLFRRLPFDYAAKFVKETDRAAQNGYLLLEWITKERFENAKKLRIKFRDKPLISFTDLTSMVVMSELGIKYILTEDEHFAQVGMDYERLPQPR